MIKDQACSREGWKHSQDDGKQPAMQTCSVFTTNAFGAVLLKCRSAWCHRVTECCHDSCKQLAQNATLVVQSTHQDVSHHVQWAATDTIKAPILCVQTDQLQHPESIYSMFNSTHALIRESSVFSWIIMILLHDANVDQTK